MNTRHRVTTVVLIAIASVFTAAAEFGAIDRLAARERVEAQAIVHLPPVMVSASRDAAATQAVVQLPTVIVTARRDAQAVAEVRHLPRVVVVGNRDSLTAKAQTGASASKI